MGDRLAVGCAALAVVLGMVGVAQAQAPRYQVRSLEAPPDCRGLGFPVGLDDRGQVLVGLCLLNPDGKVVPPDAQHSFIGASRIAGQGLVTGSAVDSEAQAEPVLWDNGQPRVLPLPAGFLAGHGQLVNRGRDVLGDVSGIGVPVQIGFWPSDGPPTTITLSPHSSNLDLWDLNANRQFVGCATFQGQFGGNDVPFLWSSGQTKILEPSSWDRPSGCAYAVNDAGVVAGTSDQRPVFWQNGALRRLAPMGLNGLAGDVNNRGVLVGTLNGRAFYSDGTNVWDLLGLVDDPTPVTALVFAINDQGQILATRSNPPPPFAAVALLEPKAPPSGADPVPPAVTMTSPWNGEPLVDLVTLKASASDNVAVAGVQFFSNGVPVGPEDTTAPYSAEADAIDMSAVPFYARARDTAGNFTSSPVRFAVVQRSCQQAAAGQALTGAFSPQTGQFTARFTGYTNDPVEGGFALASGAAGGFASTSAAVLFASDGEIKVRNGSVYVGTGVPYRLNAYHHFRMVVDVPTNRYSVWLKFANEPEKILAAGFAFRGAFVTQLDHWMVRTDENSPFPGMFSACNIRVP